MKEKMERSKPESGKIPKFWDSIFKFKSPVRAMFITPNRLSGPIGRARPDGLCIFVLNYKMRHTLLNFNHFCN